ncbi:MULTISPECIES: phosphonate ABC transporter ATP-binding protein [Congzhengia]|jgi:phosphonate transport system ATP-binding protein|uniref:Phosphonate ABC transporter ATP-binding protein n=1 Tax=Congzhengia minquanensis TaxID=2763657 RepID=A0A926DJR8_9FIRM|nr:phosphonate ABC transporter ATP-binding protein [Congzhengia minquanensis]MBC8540218.1 phosphonate ABC transporter ATP-binding protein [Congzhengia minquanensis]
MEHILELVHLKKYYGQTKAVEDVSFHVDAGEVVAIIGPSGAGKSTVLRCINRMIEPTGGSILFDGQDMAKLQKEKELKTARRKIGMIFQSFNLVYRLSVFQNVLHGRLGYMSAPNAVMGRYSEEDKHKAVQLLNMIGLKDMIYKKAGELSGGQKQRVGIARALMQDPTLLLCDEPIASLDPSSSRVIMNQIQEMAKTRNIACIVNLHQVDVAMAYADRIIGIHQGRIVFDDVPDKLTASMIETIYDAPIDKLTIGLEEGVALHA